MRARTVISAVGAALLCLTGVRAAAQEVFTGAYAHDIDTPFSLTNGESGADIAVGYRFAPLDDLAAAGRPAPYLLASINTDGDTSFAGAGLSWTIGKGPAFVRPGLGLIVHDGPSLRFAADGTRTDLGSRVLFEPELGLGFRISERVAIEAHWMHVSHARLFNRRQNPGLDMLGARLTYRLR